MFGRSKKNKVSGRVETLVGRGARIDGDVAFSGGLHLDGRVVGNVRGAEQAPPATLWVSEQGVIEGLVEVPNIVLNGSVIGDIHARERLVMGPKARVAGNVYYGVIEMAPGAEVSGKLVPTNAATAASSPAALTGPTIASGDAARDPAAKPVANVFDARRTRS